MWLRNNKDDVDFIILYCLCDPLPVPLGLHLPLWLSVGSLFTLSLPYCVLCPSPYLLVPVVDHLSSICTSPPFPTPLLFILSGGGLCIPPPFILMSPPPCLHYSWEEASRSQFSSAIDDINVSGHPAFPSLPSKLGPVSMQMYNPGLLKSQDAFCRGWGCHPQEKSAWNFSPSMEIEITVRCLVCVEPNIEP